MVRIVKGDFWTNYNNYEGLIKRCFVYLFHKKFTNFDHGDPDDSFANLLIQFQDLNVFDRFDERRPKKNFPIEKKFEQYIYKHTESVLYKEYHDRKKRTFRFKRIPDIDFHNMLSPVKNEKEDIFADDRTLGDYGWITLNETEKRSIRREIKSLRKANSNITDSRRQKELEEMLLKAKRERLYKDYPNFRDTPYLTQEKVDAPDEGLIDEETWDILWNACKTDRERRIVSYKRDGLNAEQIGEILRCSGQCICFILNSLKDRFKKQVAMVAA